MQKRQIENKRKVPLLGDIPVMGYLFRYQSSSMVNSNLVVFMRPRILQGDASIASFSHTKYNLFRTRQLQFNAEESLIPDQSPVIEDLNSKYMRNKTPSQMNEQLSAKPAMEPNTQTIQDQNMVDNSTESMDLLLVP